MIKHTKPQNQNHNLILKDSTNGEMFVGHFTLDGMYIDIFRIVEPSPALKFWLEHNDRKFNMPNVEQSVLKNWECGFIDFYAMVGTVIERCDTHREVEIQKLLENIRSRFVEVTSTLYSHSCRWLIRPAANQLGNEYLFVLMGRVLAFDQVMFDTYVKPVLETETLMSTELLDWHKQLSQVAMCLTLNITDYVAFGAHESHFKQLNIDDL